MNKTLLFLIAACAGIMLSACSSSDEPSGGDNGMEKPALTIAETEAASEINEFSIDFIKSVAEESEDNDNFAVSPLSMSMFLGMVANSGDETEICEALHCSNLTTLNSLSAKYMQWLPTTGKKLRINIANALWFEQSYTVNPDFSDIAQDVYDCDIYARDFSDLGLKDEINGWADKNTNGMIKNLVHENPIILFLANALYFKGEWDKPFDNKKTVKADFHGVDGTTTIDMMKNNLATSYFETDDAQVVKLSFAKSFSTIVMLPKGTENINDFISEKLAEHWRYISPATSEFYRCEVDLSFPKLELAPEKLNMDKVLSNLGVNNLNVNILSEKEIPLAVSQIATVRFDEKGAEAAAVTSGELSVNLPTKSAKMTVDWPFLFFINEDSTGLCLFAGKVVSL